jgi:hypothetical protein
LTLPCFTFARYNFASLADPNASIEITQEKKPMTLFIVVGVPEEYPFAPLSRNEVSEIKFVKISKLVDPASAKKLNTANMIPSIIGRLKAWLGTAAGNLAPLRPQLHHLPHLLPTSHNHSTHCFEHCSKAVVPRSLSGVKANHPIHKAYSPHHQAASRGTSRRRSLCTRVWVRGKLSKQEEPHH